LKEHAPWPFVIFVATATLLGLVLTACMSIAMPADDKPKKDPYQKRL
jgi:hypothetical protein